MVNITQSHIANKLGVSRVTVSKALRNHPDISKRMKERVAKTAHDLSYIPNRIALQLNSRRTYTLGVVIPDLENIWFACVADSIIDYATDRGYQVILAVSRENKKIELRNIQNLIGLRVDGLLACLSQETKQNYDFLKTLKLGIPVVFFDRNIGNGRFSKVIFDDKPGTIKALQKVIDMGYSEIAHLAGHSYTNVGKQRLDGYLSVLKQNNLPVRQEWIIEGGFNFIDGYSGFNKLLKARTLPQIVLTVNNMVALGAYKAAKESGLRIPADIGFLGFGFSEHTDLFDPPMSVINQDPRLMGSKATDLIINEIEGKNKNKKVLMKIPTEFIWRSSIIKRNLK